MTASLMKSSRSGPTTHSAKWFVWCFCVYSGHVQQFPHSYKEVGSTVHGQFFCYPETSLFAVDTVRGHNAGVGGALAHWVQEGVKVWISCGGANVHHGIA